MDIYEVTPNVGVGMAPLSKMINKSLPLSLAHCFMTQENSQTGFLISESA